MPISKDWFDNEIEKWTRKKSSTFDSIEIARISGIVSGLKIAYEELIKPPVKGTSKKSDINVEKGYDTILKYYMNDPKFIEQYPDIETRKIKANEIATKTMDKQQQRLS